MTRGDASPTVPPPQPAGLSPVLARNIDTLERRRREKAAQTAASDRIADAITRFAGSMRFAYIHLALFGGWLVANLGWVPGVAPWDPSFVVLAMIASVEAIFLSTFVLITQNRMAAAAEERADLDLQISLLAEHEVTRLVAMVSALTERFGVVTPVDDEVSELKADVAPEAVLDALDAEREEGSADDAR